MTLFKPVLDTCSRKSLTHPLHLQYSGDLVSFLRLHFVLHGSSDYRLFQRFCHPGWFKIWSNNHHARTNVLYTFLSLTNTLPHYLIARNLPVKRCGPERCSSAYTVDWHWLSYTPVFALPSSGEFRERSSPVPPHAESKISDVIFFTPCVRAQIPDWKLGQFPNVPKAIDSDGVW